MYRMFVVIMMLWAQLGFAAKQPDAVMSFLALSDIHFDPFVGCRGQAIPCPFIKILQQAAPHQWSAILSAQKEQSPQYREDSGYRLFASSLTAAKKAAQAEHATFVLILGDFLGHHFRTLYEKYTHDSSFSHYALFVKKTMAFMALEIAKAFPTTDVYAVVGNNDSYSGDYILQPRGRFFQDIGEVWSYLIQDRANRVVMKQVFPIGGYYAVDLPKQTNLHLIVLNSVLFSHKAPAKKTIQEAAQSELHWLHEELKLVRANGQKAFIVMHIPAGIDVYASLRLIPFHLIEWWQPVYAQQFQAELEQFAPEITGVFAGHLHTDWLQTFDFKAGQIPISGVPAISPLFGNNPGFKVYRYSLALQQLEDFVTYYDPLDHHAEWEMEYHFNATYQPHCYDCSIIKGISGLQPMGHLANYYKFFYSVSTNSQPITTQWNPYYWCAIHHLSAHHYEACIKHE